MLTITFEIEATHGGDMRESWTNPITADMIAHEIAQAKSAAPDVAFTLTEASTDRLVFTGLRTTR